MANPPVIDLADDYHSIDLTEISSIDQSITDTYTLRECIMTNVYESIGVREQGVNSGVEVDAYLSSVNFSSGYAWCGAYVAYKYASCLPTSSLETFMPIRNWAYTPNYLTSHPESVIWKSWTKDKYTYSKHRRPQSGDLLLLYNSRLGRVAHVGIIDYWSPGNRLVSIEGNTNDAGSREGDGVYVKYRDKRQVHAVVDVLSIIS
jgi:hypothetical protein